MSPRDDTSGHGLPTHGTADPKAGDAVSPEMQAAKTLFDSLVIVDAEYALHEEYGLLFGPPGPDEDVNQWMARNPRYALCLSGGGIRSAAFCMGALRALAERKLLTQFHYLSTVSGGGYIGGWLQSLIKRSDPAEAQRVLAASQAQPQVKNLRDFTNFLAPSPGLLSGDLMPGVVLYLRNVIVNWMIFLPAFMAIALTPTLYRDLIGVASAAAAAPHWDIRTVGIGTLLVAGLCGLFVGVLNACRYLPTHAYDIERKRRREAKRQDEDAAGGRGVDAKQITRRVILPVLLWAFVLPIGIAAVSPPPEGNRPVGADAYAAPAESLAAPPKIAERAGLPGDVDGRFDNTARQSPIRTQTYRAWGEEWVVPGAVVMVMLIAFGVSCRWIESAVPANQRADHRKVFWDNRYTWPLACLLSGVLLWAVIVAGNSARAEEMATLGPLLVLVAMVLQTTFYVAVRRDPLRADLDREWLARLNAELLQYGVIFAAVAACALMGPFLIAGGFRTFGTLIGIASGPAAAIMSRLATKFLDKPGGVLMSLGFRAFDVAALIAALLFAFSVLSLLSWAGQSVIEDIADWITRPAHDDKAALLSWFVVSGLTIVTVVLLRWITLWLGRTINSNRFSLHAVYRNRIVRAFLGSSRDPATRRPDRFVRFDPEDNLRMVELQRERPGDSPPCLFPVIGATLNLSSGTRTAWTERKAAPFTITPLRCGSAELDHPQIAAVLREMKAKAPDRPLQLGARPLQGGWTERDRSGAYAKTETYAGRERMHGESAEEEKGLSLGTAIALSGAAVSSNMGSHTSSALAFLATLFDLRLGMWLPNPGQAVLDPAALKPSKSHFGWLPQSASPRDPLATVRHELNKPSARNTAVSLFDEMLRKTDDEGQAIYLTDGGHFDNLGLYEMLRRRCKCILVVDVGCDPTYAYADLGDTIRRANLDFDTCVDFTTPMKVGATTLPTEGLHATILYPANPDRKLPEETGDLLIIKSWLPKDAPTEILAYKASNPAFPHDSTADQFFGESQFESYRRLGEYVTATAISHITDIEQLFAACRAGKRRAS